MKHISNGVGWRGVQPEWCMMVLLAAACTALAPTVRHASPRHEQDPLPGGLTTPFRAAQHCDQQAGRPCDQQAGRPHCAVGLTTPFRATQHRDQQAGRPCDQQAGRTLRRWRGGDSEPVRPDPPNATGRRWRLAGREGGTGRTPQHYPKARAGRRPPTPQTEQNQHPPGAPQRAPDP